MKTRLINIHLAAAAVVLSFLLTFLLTFRSAAQNATSNTKAATAQDLVPDRKTAAAKPTPRSADGHPDFNGYYNSYGEASKFSVPAENIAQNGAVGQHTLTRTTNGDILLDFYGTEKQLLIAKNEATDQPPYKPEWMAKADKIAATMWAGSTNLDPAQECKPLGVPRAGLGAPLQIVQTPQLTAIIYEESPGPVYRLIYTDGRQHPNDLDTSYMGHSIGHWEGDTLVVDTVGLNDETWLGGRGANSKGGEGEGGHAHTTIHSDKEHVIERWNRTGDVLTVQTTVEDPVAFTRPWVLAPQSTQIGARADYMQPQMCTPVDAGHFVAPSASNPESKGACSYCVPKKDYGLPSDQTNQPGPR